MGSAFKNIGSGELAYLQYKYLKKLSKLSFSHKIKFTQNLEGWVYHLLLLFQM